MPTLRPYQQDLFDTVFQTYQQGSKATMMVLPTGGGKTVVISEVLKAFKAPAVAIAHRKELVSQLSVALARNGVRHRVIGDSKLGRRIAGLHMKLVGQDFTNRNSPVAVAGVDTLVNLDPRDPWFASVKIWCIDECFVAGTLIDGKPIESLRPGDIVSAFNEETGAVEQRAVVRMFKNVAPKYMMRVKVGHHVLRCTQGHPFYTRRGWVEAGNLTLDDEVLIDELYAMREDNRIDNGKPTVSVTQDGSDILQQDLRLCPPHGNPETETASTTAASTVFRVRQNGRSQRSSIQPMEKDAEGVLRHSVFQSVPLSDIERDHGQDEQGACLGSNESQQSDATRPYEAESVGHDEAAGPPSEGAGRERETAKSSGSDAPGALRESRLCSAVPNQDADAARLGLPDLLQAGLSASVDEDCSRSGWGEPYGGTTRTGSQKRSVLSWARVDYLEVYQRGDSDGNGSRDDDGYVYNIEVEGLHTYIANGIVVHNCHHVLRENKWGKAAAMFPNAVGLLPTATPIRADRKGLGRHADGLADALVVGPTMRDLINQGFLCDYRVFVPPSDVDYSTVDVTASGDYSLPKLRAAVHKSTRIVGDVVSHYKRLATGKLGVTFAVDVEAAKELAQAYRDAGVPAEVLTGETPDELRADILRRFEKREILQITSVDILGEGFDLPAIEVVSFVRKTESFSLYAQQMGRALRPMQGKEYAIIIDHVGNFVRHGPPDAKTDWTLDRGERKRAAAVDAEAVRVCDNLNCLAAYPRRLTQCPYCNVKPTIVARSLPEYVDGDLHELDPIFLAHLRGEIDRIDGAPNISSWQSSVVQRSIYNRHTERQEAQRDLRAAIALWGGYWTAMGEDVRVVQKRFYLTWGVDVMTAQTLGVKDATALRERIEAWLSENNIQGSAT